MRNHRRAEFAEGISAEEEIRDRRKDDFERADVHVPEHEVEKVNEGEVRQVPERLAAQMREAVHQIADHVEVADEVGVRDDRDVGQQAVLRENNSVVRRGRLDVERDLGQNGRVGREVESDVGKEPGGLVPARLEEPRFLRAERAIIEMRDERRRNPGAKVGEVQGGVREDRNNDAGLLGEDLLHQAPIDLWEREGGLGPETGSFQGALLCFMSECQS
jgi:hypothetical protein